MALKKFNGLWAEGHWRTIRPIAVFGAKYKR
jgi:hypothetical protein